MPDSNAKEGDQDLPLQEPTLHDIIQKKEVVLPTKNLPLGTIIDDFPELGRRFYCHLETSKSCGATRSRSNSEFANCLIRVPYETFPFLVPILLGKGK
ncbi:hypothetical protein ACH5RR_032419 [Cinchona calisaya]|uniref:Uncharacterized protein n=1 Tax=Cinchona calisaya TaxID=153742 RepID=A0ABD2YL53_9GENT